MSSRILKFLPLLLLVTAFLTIILAKISLAQEETLEITIIVSGEGTVKGMKNNTQVINCPASQSPCSYNFPTSSVITLTALADSSSVFAGFVGGGCKGETTCEITLSDNKIVTGLFVPKESLNQPPNPNYSILTLKKGDQGKVSSEANQLIPLCASTDFNQANCFVPILKNTLVSLKATPKPGSDNEPAYEINTWTGCDSVSANTCQVLMNENKTVEVTFKIKQTTSAPCLNVTFEGDCRGNTLVWCENDNLITKNCSEFGQNFTCQKNQAGLAICAPPSQPQPSEQPQIPTEATGENLAPEAQLTGACESGLFEMPGNNCGSREEVFAFLQPLIKRVSKIQKNSRLATSRSARVAAQLLRFLGYTDSDYSNQPRFAKLVEATKEFQKDHKLPIDGKIGPITKNKIIEAYLKKIGLLGPEEKYPP